MLTMVMFSRITIVEDLSFMKIQVSFKLQS